jgi:hypothetical protein
VPLEGHSFSLLSSKRVRGVLPNGQSYPTAIFAPNTGDPDITSVCLASRRSLITLGNTSDTIRPGHSMSWPDA